MLEKKKFLLFELFFLDVLFINHTHQILLVLYDLYRRKANDLKSVHNPGDRALQLWFCKITEILKHC